MRSGTLDREIIVQRAVTTLADSGAPRETWTTVVTLRAQLVANGTSEEETAAGALDQTSLTFKTRFFDGIALGDRIVYQGQPLELRSLQEVGRRRGLELSCKRFGP